MQGIEDMDAIVVRSIRERRAEPSRDEVPTAPSMRIPKFSAAAGAGIRDAGCGTLRYFFDPSRPQPGRFQESSRE